MCRALPLLCLIAFILPIAGEDRFPPIQTAVVFSENSNRAAYKYDSGDMHAETRGNDVQISWKAADGTLQTWVMIPDDFQNQVKCEEDKCAVFNSFPCYGKCILSSPEIHLYDSSDKKLYFSVALDLSQNRPYAVFTADLNIRKTTFLFETYGSGLIRFFVSPSASLLAFLEGSRNGCASNLHLRVFDIKRKNLLEPIVRRTDESASLRENVSYESIAWLSDTQLLLKGRMWNCRDAEATDEVPTQAIVNLNDKPVQR
jgi:hypothetical protein